MLYYLLSLGGAGVLVVLQTVLLNRQSLISLDCETGQAKQIEYDFLEVYKNIITHDE